MVKQRRIVVRAVRKEQPDIRKLAGAIIEVAKSQPTPTPDPEPDGTPRATGEAAAQNYRDLAEAAPTPQARRFWLRKASEALRPDASPWL